MKPATLLAVGAALAVIASIAVVDRNRRPLPERPDHSKPALALLTSLPLVFGEAFRLDTPRAASVVRLERRYRVETIAVADAASLAGKEMLFMAHPRAQPAEALVDLDQWVRGGGSVLLLADPQSDWPSELGLGDKLRPQPAFADTGLLAHWGLRLEGPDPSGPRELADVTIDTLSPGRLVATGRDCTVTADGFVATCTIGTGRVTVVADSDFLHEDGTVPTFAAFDALDRALERLESR